MCNKISLFTIFRAIACDEVPIVMVSTNKTLSIESLILMPHTILLALNQDANSLQHLPILHIP